MRTILGLALLAALFVFLGTTRAEGEVLVEVEPISTPFVFGSDATANVSASIDCAVFQGLPPKVSARLTVEVPSGSWLHVGLFNDTAERELASCMGSRADLDWSFLVFFDPAAPQGLPEGQVETLLLIVSTENVGGERFEGSAYLNISRGLEGFVSPQGFNFGGDGKPGDAVQYALPFESTANADLNISVTFEGSPAPQVDPPVPSVVIPRAGVGDLTFSLRAPSDLLENEFREYRGTWVARSALTGTFLRNDTVFVQVYHPAPPQGLENETRNETPESERPTVATPAMSSPEPPASPSMVANPSPLAALCVLGLLALARRR